MREQEWQKSYSTHVSLTHSFHTFPLAIQPLQKKHSIQIKNILGKKIHCANSKECNFNSNYFTVRTRNMEYNLHIPSPNRRKRTKKSIHKQMKLVELKWCLFLLFPFANCLCAFHPLNLGNKQCFCYSLGYHVQKAIHFSLNFIFNLLFNVFFLLFSFLLLFMHFVRNNQDEPKRDAKILGIYYA